MNDFVIIGGGVYGAATAWWLARAGATVTIIDEQGIASRASGGPGQRGVRANGRDGRELPLMARAYDIWPTLHEELDSPPFYTRVGQLLLTEREADPRLEARAWLQRQHGVETEVLSREAVRDMEPNVSNRVTGALYCPKDGVADHGATTRAYAAAAEKLGVQIQTGVRASTIATQGSRADGVITNEQERLPARKGVLVLANSAVAALTSPWLSLPLWNECLQVIVSRPLASVPFTHLTGHMSRTVSLKTEGADRVMVSGGWHGHWDLDTETGSTLHDAVAGNLAEAKEVYPDLAPI